MFCIQDKFGDHLAQNGGRLYALYDELLMFLNGFNMVGNKSKGSESKEYQEMLTLYNGKAKRRQTCKYINFLLLVINQSVMLNLSNIIRFFTVMLLKMNILVKSAMQKKCYKPIWNSIN